MATGAIFTCRSRLARASVCHGSLPYQRLGATRDMGLGSFNDVTLAEARGLANPRRARCCGTAAIQSRPATTARLQKQLEAARTISFDKAATLYLDAHRATWGNFKHRQQWERSLKAYASPILGKASVRQIDTALVLQVIEPMWLNKTETANRVRRRIEKILDWARAKGYRQGA